MSQLYFFNHPASTALYTLSLHDALPISPGAEHVHRTLWSRRVPWRSARHDRHRIRRRRVRWRSEEHTSELQSHSDLVCRLLLEKKNKPNVTRRPARNKCYATTALFGHGY